MLGAISYRRLLGRPLQCKYERGEVTRMIDRIKSLFKDEEGATLVEYALMIALIAAVCVAVIVIIGQKSNNAFNKINQNMPNN